VKRDGASTVGKGIAKYKGTAKGDGASQGRTKERGRTSLSGSLAASSSVTYSVGYFTPDVDLARATTICWYNYPVRLLCSDSVWLAGLG
jgi:hypothetical protein